MAWHKFYGNILLTKRCLPYVFTLAAILEIIDICK